MPITRIKVGRGLTKRPSEGEELWERRYFEVEAEVGPSEVPDQVKDYLEMKLSEWLEEASRAGEVEAIPKIDISDLDKAGWLTYHTKVEADPETPAWLKNPEHFTSYEPPQVVFELVKAIKRSPGEKLQLGDMEYSFSGEGKFISRRPIKR